MKKSLNLFLLVAILATTISFVSCKKDKSLAGTTWTNTEEVLGVSATTTLEFVNDTECSMTTTTMGFSIPASGTYTYDHPDVSITVGEDTYKGTVDGDTMTLTQDGESMVFTKK